MHPQPCEDFEGLVQGKADYSLWLHTQVSTYLPTVSVYSHDSRTLCQARGGASYASPHLLSRGRRSSRRLSLILHWNRKILQYIRLEDPLVKKSLNSTPQHSDAEKETRTRLRSEFFFCGLLGFRRSRRLAYFISKLFPLLRKSKHHSSSRGRASPNSPRNTHQYL